MTLYHATTRQALPSILAEGLLTGKSRADAKIRGVWLHTASKTPWAILHTQRRHKATLGDVVVIEVRISRYARRSGTLRRFQRGVWYSVRDITVTQLGRVHDATQWAQGAGE